MSLILCRKEPVKAPFYFEGLGIRLYSSQELCYAIYNNPLLVMDGFVDKNLISFIRDELDMAFLAGKLEKWQQSGEDGDELLVVILQDCDYYNAAEVSRFKQRLASYRRMGTADFLKARADFLFSMKQYGKAISEYNRILELPPGGKVNEAYLSKVYNNLGASYARLFMTAKACHAYEKSFELVKNEAVLKRICYLLQWNPAMELSGQLKALMTEELKRQCEKDKENAEDAAERAESLMRLDYLFQKDPIKRMAGAGELVQKWKTEYRNIMS